MLNEARGILYINRKDPKYGVDSKVALDSLQRVAPHFFDTRLNFFYVEKPEY